MFLLDKPYISDFLRKTINKYSIPVVKTDIVEALGFKDGQSIISEAHAVEIIKNAKDFRILTTSENSIGWIAKNLSFTNLPKKIEQFKNKAKFRELIKSLNPDYFFKEVKLEDLKNLSVNEIPVPFIIKPTTGFFSMGVHKVTSIKDWGQTVDLIHSEILRMNDIYPEEVLDTTSFIIEDCIKGEEYAVDAYFDSAGEPVIMGIFKHVFSSSEDVSDRVYTTSKDIVEENIKQFYDYLKEVGKLADVQNFPIHMEIRRDDSSRILPIEINPMRFGGWCTTADITWLAYGFNQYEYYFAQKKPDWTKILKNKTPDLYSIIVLDNSTGIDISRIKSFDYDKLLTRFEHVLELRKIDFGIYPVFAFLFAKTSPGNFGELERILTSSLREFITTEE